MSEEAEHAISFASRKSSGLADLGHAFIVQYVLENDGKRYVKRALGFYPVGDKYNLVVAVNGTVLDDSELEIDRQLIVQVSTPVYEIAATVESQYNDATWVLGANDCVSFIEQVASVVPSLSTPSRALFPTPSAYISALFSSN